MLRAERRGDRPSRTRPDSSSAASSPCARRAPGSAGGPSARASGPARRSRSRSTRASPRSRPAEQALHAVADHRVPRPWPTCIGPVGFADTYSTMTFLPCPPRSARTPRPGATARSSARSHTSGATRTLTNPGPAISRLATSPAESTARTSSTIAWASSRGGLPAAFASTIAAFTAKSPCFGSRGASTENAASAAGHSPRRPLRERLTEELDDAISHHGAQLYRARAAGASGQSRGGRGSHRASGVSRTRRTHRSVGIARRARARRRRSGRSGGAAAAEQRRDEQIVARRELAGAGRVRLAQELAHLPGHLAAPVALERAAERRERVGGPAEPVERAPVEEVQRRIAPSSARRASTNAAAEAASGARGERGPGEERRPRIARRARARRERARRPHPPTRPRPPRRRGARRRSRRRRGAPRRRAPPPAPDPRERLARGGARRCARIGIPAVDLERRAARRPRPRDRPASTSTSRSPSAATGSTGASRR